MKLFVWTDVYSDYTSGMAWAIAQDSERARELIIEEVGYACAGLGSPPSVYDLTAEAVDVCKGGS